MKTYNINNVSGFKKVKDQWGEFSNMSAFPLNVNGISVKTSEALYQALRYPHNPEIQKVILEQKSPMAAKMKSKPHREKETHSDFINNQVEIMEWVVRLKVAQHYYKLAPIMRKAEEVVEISHKDKFWGAVPLKGNKDVLVGQNQLGQIWNKIISEFKKDPKSVKTVPPLGIESMKLLGKSLNFTYSTK